MRHNLDETIAEMQGLSRKEVLNWQQKALAVLGKDPRHADGMRLKVATDNALAHLDRRRLIKVGQVEWQPYNQQQCAGFVAGVQVGFISVEGNHTAARKDVYTVQILGQSLPDRFDTIESARIAGSHAYASVAGE